MISKAMSNLVRVQILDELSQGPRTLDELAVKANLKTESIHHHIQILQQTGLIEELEPVRTGGPGRPYARFKLTGKTVSIQYPHRNYYMLSDVLLENISEFLGEEKIIPKLRKIGVNIGEEVAQALSTQYNVNDWTLQKFRDHFVEGYSKAAGAQPEVVSSNDKQLVYRTYNCLFLELVKKYPDLVCTMHEGLMEGLTTKLLPNAETKRLKCIGHGDNVCEYMLKLKQ